MEFMQEAPFRGRLPVFLGDDVTVKRFRRTRHGIELIPDTSYILEAGFERLHGVDFRKGCYVGQEVTARMKHKTELRKGLMRVAVTGTAPVGTAITAGERTLGQLFTQSGGFGIAYLRHDWVEPEMRAGTAVLHPSPAR
ncbi:MAG: hypothetical protein HC783_03685 [Rhodobacteraceae bacterium]|nr:hypothetical protein [Paracoccaceae bacterium]